MKKNRPQWLCAWTVLVVLAGTGRFLALPDIAVRADSLAGSEASFQAPSGLGRGRGWYNRQLQYERMCERQAQLEEAKKKKELEEHEHQVRQYQQKENERQMHRESNDVIRHYGEGGRSLSRFRKQHKHPRADGGPYAPAQQHPWVYNHPQAQSH